MAGILEISEKRVNIRMLRARRVLLAGGEAARLGQNVRTEGNLTVNFRHDLVTKCVFDTLYIWWRER